MCILIFSVPASVSSYFPHYPLQHTVGCTYTTLMNLDYFKYDLLVAKKLKTGEDHYRLDQQVAKPSTGLEVSEFLSCLLLFQDRATLVVKILAMVVIIIAPTL